ncbi:hypothetical protein ACH4TV_46490 [Streptomyces sp. NPDC020898]|uniref:hypothetical protein n=1 Tax=Streptomyces sp. NPDC020898 TaxID=3365101 RepID=UPI00378E9BCC
MTTALYEIETSEGDDDTAHPAECLWTPGEDAADNGFVVHHGLYVTGIAAPNDDGPHPDRFIVLGHQRWADIIGAAAAYMDRVHNRRDLQNRMNCSGFEDRRVTGRHVLDLLGVGSRYISAVVKLRLCRR